MKMQCASCVLDSIMEVSDEEKVSPRQIVDQYMLKISDDSADDLDV